MYQSLADTCMPAAHVVKVTSFIVTNQIFVYLIFLCAHPCVMAACTFSTALYYYYIVYALWIIWQLLTNRPLFRLRLLPWLFS
jgi:hypothetical protein